jgi:phage tail sheath protein FI
MSAEQLSAKIIIQEEEPRIRTIVGVPTAVTAFIGVTERGPVAGGPLGPNGEIPGPVRLTSYDQYTKNFGGHVSGRATSLAVAGFFDNGGSACWVVRVVHYTDVTDANTLTSVAATVTINDGSAVATLAVSGKTHGAYGNSLSAVISDATNGDASFFNLEIVRNSVTVEVFPNLTMDDTDLRYVDDVIGSAFDETNPSNLVITVDQNSITAPPGDRPANGTYPLLTGDDGLVGLVDADFTGGIGVGVAPGTGSTGMRALDGIDEIRLLAVPGEATSAIHNGMLTYCEFTRSLSMFAVLDSVAGHSATQVKTYVLTTASLKEASEFGAIYWPHIRVQNPSTAVFGVAPNIIVPPSGHICGVYARTDQLQGGVSEAPAGVEVGRIAGALGVANATVNQEGVRDLLLPELINPIVKPTGQPVHIDGARTLKSTGNFPTVGERRLAIFVEQSIKAGLLFGKHRKIKPALLAQFNRSTRSFMITLTREGNFASDKPREAFFVDFGAGLNTPITASNRQTLGRIGLATAKPNEFTLLFFSQDQRALEEAIEIDAA